MKIKCFYVLRYGGSYKFGSSSSSGGPNTTLSLKEQKKRKLTGKNPYVYY
jgi:hypothetical protein